MMNCKDDTPCVGLCSTVYGDDICRGCRRHMQEIIDWNACSDEQKRCVFQRLGAAIDTVLPQWLVVVDAVLLRDQLVKRAIAVRSEASCWEWALALLRTGASRMQELSYYGLMRHPQCDPNKSISQLYEQIDEALYEHACRQVNR